MRVQDVMSVNVKTIESAATAEDAWTLMRVNRIRHLVVTGGRRVVGLLSERDLGGARGASARANRLVGELMSAPAVTVESTMTLRQAANVMRGRAIGSLVVVDSSRPVGIVTVSDLLELVGRGLDRGAVMSRRPPLHYRAPHRKRKAPAAAW
jgi:CBS domain-containing protein